MRDDGNYWDIREPQTGTRQPMFTMSTSYLVLFFSMHIKPLIRIQTIAKLDSVGITSGCVCPDDNHDLLSGRARGRSRRPVKIEEKDKIKETARIIVDPENDKIPDSVVRMRTETIDITPFARSRSPALKVSRPHKVSMTVFMISVINSAILSPHMTFCYFT